MYVLNINVKHLHILLRKKKQTTESQQISSLQDSYAFRLRI